MAAATTLEENKQIVHRFVDEVVNKSNYDRIDEFVAEDFIDHTPFGETRGRDAYETLLSNSRPRFRISP